MSAESKPAADQLTDEQIAQWLTAHPDFFIEHADLLDALHLPQQQSDDTISFQAHQVRRLRERNTHLEALFQQGHRNQALIDRTLSFATESQATQPRSLPQALETQQKLLHRHFPRGQWAIRLRPEIPDVPEDWCVPEHAALVQTVMAVFRKGPQVLTDRETVALLWPKSKTDSQTLLVAPLKRARRYGILCQELPQEPHSDGDTALLMHVANLTAARLAQFCKTPGRK